MARYRLTNDHCFNLKCGPIVLLAGSEVGDNGSTDYPIGNIVGFAATTAMVGLDSAGTTAVSAAVSAAAGKSCNVVAHAPHAANSGFSKCPTARPSGGNWASLP